MCVLGGENNLEDDNMQTAQVYGKQMGQHAMKASIQKISTSSHLVQHTLFNRTHPPKAAETKACTNVQSPWINKRIVMIPMVITKPYRWGICTIAPMENVDRFCIVKP